MRFYDMLGSAECPYNFKLDLSKGTQYAGKGHYPRLTVLGNESVHVREVKCQVILVRAESPETGKTEEVQIMRMVAVLEGGTEMELSRMAVPSDIADRTKGDPSICTSCRGRIPHGAGTKVDDDWYHYGCVSE